MLLEKFSNHYGLNASAVAAYTSANDLVPIPAMASSGGGIPPAGGGGGAVCGGGCGAAWGGDSG